MNILRDLRKRKNMSQTELAEKMELAVTTISRYETNKRKIPVENAKKLGKILEVNWIIFFSN